MITCSDCGFSYGDHEACCPKCGNPTANSARRTDLSNCPNCGAPINGGVSCAYCGSAYPKPAPRPQPVYQRPQQQNDDGLSTVAALAIGAIVGGILSD